MLKPSNPAVVVLGPFDVVLSEIITALNFDDDDIIFPGVLDSVPRALGNVHRLAALQMEFILVDGHDGASLDDMPVFLSAKVSLETQTLLREHNNPLHFMVRLIGKDAEITPGPVLFRFWNNHTR